MRLSSFLMILGFLSLSSVCSWADSSDLPCPEAVEIRLGEFDHRARDKCIEEKKARIRDEKAALYAPDYYIEKIDVHVIRKWDRTAPDAFRAWFYCSGWIEESMVPYQCKRKNAGVPEFARNELEATPLEIHDVRPDASIGIEFPEHISFSSTASSQPVAPSELPKKNIEFELPFDLRECGKKLTRREIDAVIQALRAKAASIPPQPLKTIAADILGKRLVQCAYDYTQKRFHHAIAAKFRALNKPVLDWKKSPMLTNSGKRLVFEKYQQEESVQLASSIVLISQGAAGYPIESVVAVRPNLQSRNDQISSVATYGFDSYFSSQRDPKSALKLYEQSNTLQIRMANPDAPAPVRNVAELGMALITLTRMGNYVYYTSRGRSGDGEGFFLVPAESVDVED